MKSRLFSLLLLALFISLSAADSEDDNCVYTLYVKTGSFFKAGTNSNISLTLGDASGHTVKVANLKTWGAMGPYHDYFERDNVDIFTARGNCIDSPVCKLDLTSDGSGSHHGWYCEYVEVTSTRPHRSCSQTIFYVEQWLAYDIYPYKLSAVLDVCHKKTAVEGNTKNSKHAKLVVGSPKKPFASS